MNSETTPDHSRYHVFADADALAHAAAGVIAQLSNDAIVARGRFDIVLAGGSTPRQTYEQLRNTRCLFDRWHVWFGDERCLPPSDVDRNDTMARTALLDHVDIPCAQIHAMPAETGPTNAACAYAQQLRDIAMFDLVLLGLGEDGHTASLFPGHEIGIAPDSASVLAVRNAPKPPPERVSLSAMRLAQTRRLMFLVAGAKKRDAVSRVQHGDSIPATAIRPDTGVDVYVTRDTLSVP